ncbi:MAG: VacJ family lipoprotein [Desulfobacterales bacterium]|nr:VacJ family lipoprotein [Desulfobacterales bacterium]
MRRAGILILLGGIVWLTSTTAATAGSHADLNNIFSKSHRASDNEQFETWGAQPAYEGDTVPDSQRYQETEPLLWAQNDNGAAEDEFADEWDDEWDDEDEVAEEIPDPLMGLNWLFFQFNDKFYRYLWEPLAQGYGFVVPEPARKGVRNFFSNLTTPIRLVNCLLQGKWDDAGNETARFMINTTAGVLGFGDPALEDYGPPKDEDFGQTLGYWGLNDGFFLTLPFIGPSSLRDGIGFVADGYLHPVSYLDGKPYKTKWYKIAIRGFERFNATSFQIGEYDKLKGMALDPYVAIRNAWWQNRQKKIAE